MTSTAASPRRLRLGLAVIVGLGLSVLSLPALAGVGDREAPLVVADNYKNKHNTWNNTNNNWTNPNKKWNKNWNKNYRNKNWKNRYYVRTWKPRPYYGQFFGGVVLGSILTAAAIGVAPVAPAPGLCWYWSDPYGYRGYWDYCAPYPPY
jgi:hypothetical protein